MTEAIELLEIIDLEKSSMDFTSIGVTPLAESEPPEPISIDFKGFW